MMIPRTTLGIGHAHSAHSDLRAGARLPLLNGRDAGEYRQAERGRQAVGGASRTTGAEATPDARLRIDDPGPSCGGSASTACPARPG